MKNIFKIILLFIIWSFTNCKKETLLKVSIASCSLLNRSTYEITIKITNCGNNPLLLTSVSDNYFRLNEQGDIELLMFMFDLPENIDEVVPRKYSIKQLNVNEDFIVKSIINYQYKEITPYAQIINDYELKENKKIKFKIGYIDLVGGELVESEKVRYVDKFRGKSFIGFQEIYETDWILIN